MRQRTNSHYHRVGRIGCFLDDASTVDILTYCAIVFGQLLQLTGLERYAHVKCMRETQNAEGTSPEGLIVNSAISFVSQSPGEAALKNILAGFDSEAISAKRLLPSDWVPEKTYRNFLVPTGQYLESTARDKKPKEFFFEMGRFTANDGINKYYKSLIRMFDTKFMLTRSPLPWGVMHTHGSLKVEPIGKTGAYVYISHYPAPCKEFCYTIGRIYAQGG